MGNHYHLLIETPQPNLVQGMKWVQSTFANRFNRFRKVNGHVFQGRYNAILLESDAVGPVCHYIHLNPVRGDLVQVAQLQEYPDCSFHQLWYPGLRWSFGDYETCIRAAGGFADIPRDRLRYRDFLTHLSGEKSAQNEMGFESMSHGWAMGSQDFKKEVLSNCQDEKLRRVVEAEASEMREPRWERGLAQALVWLGKNEADLAKGRKGEPWKVSLAYHLRERFLAPYRWMSRRLNMGESSSLLSLVSRHRRQQPHTDETWKILRNHEYLD